ncbi:MAG: hypothetical protein PHU78_04385 [Heliobacteriaceae bacterium]|nr:hypothetical protein [Heliobacteriaceae bacterium]
MFIIPKIKSALIFGGILIACLSICGLYISSGSAGALAPPATSSVLFTSFISDADKPEWLAKTSDLAVIVQVVKNEAPAEGKMVVKKEESVIYTDTKVQVKEILNQNTGLEDNICLEELLTVRTLGGRLNDQEMFDDSSPEFVVGKDMLLFLMDGKKVRKLPYSEEPYYYVSAGYNGAFCLENGLAVRTKLNDQYTEKELRQIIINH